MATRFFAEFDNLQSRRYSIYVDDSEYVGDPVEFNTGGDGFTIDHQGDNKGRLSRLLGSAASFGMAILDGAANQADLLTFITDLTEAAEGRFTVKITRGTGGSETLHWCGYVLPDISRLDDKGTGQEFRVSATDGLARLKGIEYKDDSGAADAPYGMATFLTHILRCLNEDGLSALYFTGSDIFLRTVVNWQEDGHGTPATAKCPLAYTRMSGQVWAELKAANLWEYRSCYEVLGDIARHLNARLLFSDGCYRFEQLNLRADTSFVERRFSTAGTLISSSSTQSYEETLNQDLAGARLGGGEYGWLPPLKQVKINYDHRTAKNYLQNSSYKWFKTSSNNDAYTISNIAFDADSYIKVSGKLKLKVTGPTTAPWRQVFAMYLDVGSYRLRRHSSAVQPFYLIQYDTPAQWQIASVRADISTDFVFSGSFDGVVNFSFWTPIVPSGVNSITIDFDEYGAFNGIDSNVLTTISDWAFQDLTLQIVGINTADNYEAKRVYYSNNTVAGNSEIVEENHLFGHPAKPYTPGKIQVSSDGATWVDATATWTVQGGTTEFEFGQLCAAEILSAQTEPLQTYSGNMIGNLVFAHYRIITAADAFAWLMMRCTFVAQLERLSGEWWKCDVKREKALTEAIGYYPHTPDIAVQLSEFTAPSPNVNINVANGTNVALNALANNFSSSSVSSGSVSSIPVTFPIKANAYEVGDEIIMVNPQSGKVSTLTITANSAQGDTALAVSGTLDEDMPPGAFIIYSSLNKTTTEGGPSAPALGLASYDLTTGANSIDIPEGCMLEYFVALHVTDTGVIIVGTTNGGSEVMDYANYDTAGYTNQVLRYFAATTTIYFVGFTGTLTVKIKITA